MLFVNTDIRKWHVRTPKGSYVRSNSSTVITYSKQANHSGTSYTFPAISRHGSRSFISAVCHFQTIGARKM